MIEGLKKDYRKKKSEIVKRLNEFKNVWQVRDNKKLFEELCFCLLTPQSKAKICWNAVLRLKSNDFKNIGLCLEGVRFKNNKTKYIQSAMKSFENIKKNINQYNNIYELREWLVKNVKGLGYKESSHFLRNIGKGENIAILDRHILKNLKKLGVIKKIPLCLTAKTYIEIENKMKTFSKKIGIPVSHLDLLFWSKETGEIFK